MGSFYATADQWHASHDEAGNDRPVQPSEPAAARGFAGRVQTYVSRAERRMATQIKPHHIDKILTKLNARRSLLRERLAREGTRPASARTARKLDLVERQIARAQALRNRLS